MRHRLRLPLAFVMVAVAGLATIATSPAPGPSARDQLRFKIELSQAQPVVARRVLVRIDNGDSDFESATLIVSPGASAHPEIWVSLVPEDPGEPLRPSGRYLNAYAEHQFTEVCQQGCERSYVVVTRLVDATGPDATGVIAVDLIADYVGTGGAAPSGATVSLHLDPEPVPSGADALVRQAQSGVLEIGPAAVGVNASTVGEWTGELHLSAASVSGVAMLGYPLAGRITVRGVTTETGDWPPLDLTLDVRNSLAYGSLSADYPLEPIEVDWLTLCAPNEDCDLPVTLRLEWFRAPDETPPGGDRSGRFEFELIAELAYLDGAQPPAGTELRLETR